MYDAIVIGARCAGSPSAMLLARKGYKVLLVDRDMFPSDTLSTHVIWQPGVAALAQWGLLDQVADSNCPALKTIRLDLGPLVLRGNPSPVDGVDVFYAPRRKVLDTILVEAAAAAGVEVHDGCIVQELIVDDGRVVGVRAQARDKTPLVARAPIVIGADGLHSLVARQMQAEEYHQQPSLTCWYYTYWSGVPTDGMEIYLPEGCAFNAIPTNDGLTCIGVIRKNAEFERVREDIEAYYFAALDRAPDLAARVRAGKREERFLGTASLPNYLRKPYGPGWALVGDAGYHKDPFTAQGISDAFRQAELLAEAVHDGLSGRQPMEEALAAYHAQRDDAVLPMYTLTCQFAALEPPPPEMLQLIAALPGNQEQIDRFLGVNAGSISPADFFSPENVQRIFAQAQQPAATGGRPASAS